jgi:hypothetical protein
MKKKVLHLFIADKFTKLLIPFLNENFETEVHAFLGLLDQSNSNDFKAANIEFFESPLRKNLFKNTLLFYKRCKNADKIIIHGSVFNHFFFLFPAFLKKTYWIILGSELYTIPNNPNIEIRLRKFVLHRVSHHVTHIEGDSILANHILNANAKLIYSPLYLSNTVATDDFEITKLENKEVIHVLVGNSLSKNNNHLEIFDWLKHLNDNKIKVYSPLSYGNDLEYRREVIEKGQQMFGENFFPIVDFMDFDSYKKFLKNIDIAVLDHHRQEALGVTLTLLSLGKLVYVNPKTTSYESLIKKGITIFENKLLLESGLRISRDVTNNKVMLEKYYSTDSLLQSYREIYN